MKKALLPLVSISIAMACLPSTISAQEGQPAAGDPFQTAMVLKAGRQYAARLKQAALDFVCLEEVTEKIDLTRERPPDFQMTSPQQAIMSFELSADPKQRFAIRQRGVKRTKEDNTYIFDYQFTRQEGVVKEQRVCLKKNGKKADAREAPKTQAFQYADILLMAAGLLEERFQDYYIYTLKGEDVLGGETAWVLKASPRPGLGVPCLGGTIWLSRKDSSILKIEWDPATFGGYDNIMKRAESYKEEPRVVSYTEFGCEKNGLRFPSLDFTEEAYLGKEDKVFVRSRTSIVYRDYKFFTVETETGPDK